MTLGSVVRVLQNLLKEQISIRDLQTIFETLADEAPRNKDIDSLTENVRKNLSSNHLLQNLWVKMQKFMS